MTFFIFLIQAHSQEWKNYNWNRTSSNIKYYILDSGVTNLNNNDSALINFIWFSESNKKILFNTYNKNIGPQKFIVSNNYFVKGFQESVSLLKEGGKGYFIIPPEMSYGEAGIQGEKTLCYYIEIVSVRKKKEK